MTVKGNVSMQYYHNQENHIYSKFENFCVMKFLFSCLTYHSDNAHAFQLFFIAHINYENIFVTKIVRFPVVHSSYLPLSTW